MKSIALTSGLLAAVLSVPMCAISAPAVEPTPASVVESVSGIASGMAQSTRIARKLGTINGFRTDLTGSGEAKVSGTKVSNAPKWSLSFSEDFTRNAPLGSFLTTYTNFEAYPRPWTDTSRNVRSNPGVYNPEKTLSVNNGALDAWLHYDAVLGEYAVAAPVPKMTNQTYGRYSMRLRADKIEGYKIAPLLWPVSERWPNDGEIDMPEGDLDGTPFAAFMHYARATGGQDYFSTQVNPTAWHVYEILWSPGRVEFRVDDVTIGVSTRNVPGTPMRWVLQMETQISATAPPVTSSGHVQIDWVKAYRYVR